jgi:hypothetical protein
LDSVATETNAGVTSVQWDDASRKRMEHGVEGIKRAESRGEETQSRVMSNFFDIPAFDYFQENGLLCGHHACGWLSSVQTKLQLISNHPLNQPRKFPGRFLRV